MPSQKHGGKKKGTGRKKRTVAKRMAYYEITYPLRKLLRIWKDTGRVAPLRAWADQYKTPTGVSGNAVLVRFAKLYNINLQEG